MLNTKDRKAVLWAIEKLDRMDLDGDVNLAAPVRRLLEEHDRLNPPNEVDRNTLLLPFREEPLDAS